MLFFKLLVYRHLDRNKQLGIGCHVGEASYPKNYVVCIMAAPVTDRVMCPL